MLPKEKKLDPRIVRTRRDLATSMCTLLREKPFNQITVQEITEQAIINRATFYAHFEDKFGLLEYMVLGAFREKLESKTSSCSHFNANNLEILTFATCEFLEEFSNKYKPRIGSDHPPIEGHIQPYMYNLLLEWVKTSNADTETELSAETIAMTASWAIFGTALQWSRGKKEVSARVLTTQLLALLTPGFAPLL